MGRWRLDIVGEGPAMNHRNQNDVDQLAGVLLRELIEHGHKMTSAFCESGGQRSVVTVAPPPVEEGEAEGVNKTVTRRI